MRFRLAAALALLASPALAQDVPLSVRLLALGAQPCPGSQMPCVSLPLPRDHRAPTNETIDIKFAVSLASQQPAGIVFYAVGGPGQSGLTRIDSFVASIAPELRASIDFVFFEPRGTGDAHFIDCPGAASRYVLAGLPAADIDAAIATAQQFAEDCRAETPNADLIPFTGTDQSVQDLEAFRQAIGSPRVYLQGESYGTEFMQAYAANFPDAVRGMVLDGIVDPDLSALDNQLNQLTAAERVLGNVLSACRSDISACARDMAGDPVEIFDALTTRLAEAPIGVDYPLPDGTASPRQLTATMLSGLTQAALYDGAGRAGFLRALAAASHEDFLPLLRLGYSLFGIIPGPMSMGSVRGFSDAAYFATTCGDIGESAADPAARARQMIDEAAALADRAPHFVDRLYAERVTCLYWPSAGTEKRVPFSGGDFPVLLLASSSDPVTPPSRAYALLDAIESSRLVVIDGGPHVAFARGNACPDRIVAQFLLTGELPAPRLQICRQALVQGYVPLTLPDLAAVTPLDLIEALDTEFWQLPEMRQWTGSGPLAVGCNFGGAVEARLGALSAEYEFRSCALWPGLAVTGLLTEGDGESRFEIEVSGAHQGALSAAYEWDTRGFAVSGTWDGAPVETPRPID